MLNPNKYKRASCILLQPDFVNKTGQLISAVASVVIPELLVQVGSLGNADHLVNETFLLIEDSSDLLPVVMKLLGSM
ncbi:uncharacterized protein N7459_002762 [Penicillium hispanicum]|uniref:uncharacterized protein n=1 Tax=Penicillium hispanicum TaxID=1080232 RepID=UPI0025425686|nr:uncharacterized protein N7459_002762 [Penicillium hispanicum]KAJ5586997.1 hypothetical protein N7459_002762 [Penicillium hispanicum]